MPATGDSHPHHTGSTGTDPAGASRSTEEPSGPAGSAGATHPDSPTDLTKRSWKLVLRTSLRQFTRDQCLDLAAALTYYAVLASAPALLALVSILGLVGDGGQLVDDVLGIVSSVLPEETLATVEPLIDQVASQSSGAGLALVVGLAGALWSASGYVGAFGRALNRVYEVEEGRPIWKLRPVNLLITLAVAVGAALVVVALVLSGGIAQAVGDTIGLGSAALTVWSIAKWPVVLLVVIVMVALLYHSTPNVKQPKFRWLSVGAGVAILVWAIASAGFGVYVATLGSYGSTYGTLGTVIVFLLWLWITNLALLFGAEIDSELERGRELQSGLPAEGTLQLPPRDTRGIEKRATKMADDVAEGRAIRLEAQRQGRHSDETGPADDDSHPARGR
jgi:membrane protein